MFEEEKNETMKDNEIAEEEKKSYSWCGFLGACF